MRSMINFCLSICAAAIIGSCTKENIDSGKTLPSSKIADITEYAIHKNGEDWADAFEIALTERDTIFVPQGEYKCSEIRVPSGKTIIGSGNKTVFTPLGTRLFIIEGVKHEGVEISSDISDYTNKIYLKQHLDLQPGDDILIQSQRNSMLREGIAGVNYDIDWVLGRTRKSSVFFGEFDEVLSISGNSLTTKNNRIFPSYFKDNSREPVPPTDGFIERNATTVHKIDMISDVHLNKFRIIGTSQCYQVLYIRYAKNCSVESVEYNSSVETFDKSGNTSFLSVIYCAYSRGIKITDCHSNFSEDLIKILHSKEKAYVNYSIYNIFKVMSCWDSGFESCSSNGATHAFNITRSNSADGISSGNCYVRNCTASNNVWGGIKVVQGCWNSEIVGNTIYSSPQGIVCAGRSALIKGNIIKTTYPFTTNFYYTHIKSTQTTDNGKIEVYWGGTAGIMLNEGYSCGSKESPTVVENNEIDGFYTGLSVRDGYENKNIFEEGYMLFQNNKISNCFNGVGIYRNAFNTHFVNLFIDIKNNEFMHRGHLEDELGGKTREACGVYISHNIGNICIFNNKFKNFKYPYFCAGYSENIGYK